MIFGIDAGAIQNKANSWNTTETIIPGTTKQTTSTNPRDLLDETTYQQYLANLLLQEQSQKYNTTEAEKNRKFQELMSNTQYQRATEDLRKAGLNPWLVMQNLTASTPSGSQATSSGASISRGLTNEEKNALLAQSNASNANAAKTIIGAIGTIVMLALMFA